jgi:AcrR family transcriptional regulator
LQGHHRIHRLIPRIRRFVANGCRKGRRAFTLLYLIQPGALLDDMTVATYIADSPVTYWRRRRFAMAQPSKSPSVAKVISDVSARGPRWERRKKARPQELLAAALDIFVERGFAAARLEDVAARAGVSKGTLYLYFDSKESLFKSVVRTNMLPLLEEAEGMVDRYEGHSADLLRDLILGWWASVADTKLNGISKLMMAESGNFPELAQFYHAEVITRCNATIVRMLERGIRRGEFRAIDAENMKRVIVAPVLMLMLWSQSFGPCAIEPVEPGAYLDNFIDLCLNGLLTKP